MAQAFCPVHGDEHVRYAEKPLVSEFRRRRKVGRGYEPEGYPNSAVVCQHCDKEALIWLGDKEHSAYLRGGRIFSFPGGLGRVRVR